MATLLCERATIEHSYKPLPCPSICICSVILCTPKLPPCETWPELAGVVAESCVQCASQPQACAVFMSGSPARVCVYGHSLLMQWYLHGNFLGGRSRCHGRFSEVLEAGVRDAAEALLKQKAESKTAERKKQESREQENRKRIYRRGSHQSHKMVNPALKRESACVHPLFIFYQKMSDIKAGQKDHVPTATERHGECACRTIVTFWNVDDGPTCKVGMLSGQSIEIYQRI